MFFKKINKENGRIINWLGYQTVGMLIVFVYLKIILPMKNCDSLLYDESYKRSIKECFMIAILATLAMNILSILMTYFTKRSLGNQI